LPIHESDFALKVWARQGLLFCGSQTIVNNYKVRTNLAVAGCSDSEDVYRAAWQRKHQDNDSVSIYDGVEG